MKLRLCATCSDVLCTSCSDTVNGVMLRFRGAESCSVAVVRNIPVYDRAVYYVPKFRKAKLGKRKLRGRRKAAPGLVYFAGEHKRMWRFLWRGHLAGVPVVGVPGAVVHEAVGPVVRIAEVMVGL